MNPSQGNQALVLFIIQYDALDAKMHLNNVRSWSIVTLTNKKFTWKQKLMNI